MIVADTNVVSVLLAGHRDLDRWLDGMDTGQIFTTAITRAEVRAGIARLPDGARRRDLSDRADSYFTAVADRTLAFDSPAADRFGTVDAERRRIGRPISLADAQIAAIALVHGATVATRNVRDFEGVGLKLVDPFTWSPT